MTPERWKLVERIFHAVVDLPEDERDNYLEDTCGNDAELRREIDLLLEKDVFPNTPIDALIGRQAALFSGEADDLSGTSVGPYTIVRKIGSGGMGTVYLARDIRLQRSVALKVLPGAFSTDSDRLRRFQIEARAASAINHPNIITIHEVEKIDNLYFMISEYVEGQTLAQRISGKPLPLSDVIDLSVQLAEGLAEAHRLGIVHRDIKPGNVMITSRGVVKILDFGLAKIFEFDGRKPDEAGKTASGMILGTLQYMSPEQSTGKNVDHKSDLYSLGVLMFEMCTGHLPYSGETMLEALHKINHADPEPVSRFRKELPWELERILRKCLEKDPERRYQSAHEIVVDLKNLKRAVDSGQKIPLSSAHSKLQRFRSIAIFAVLVLLLGVAGYYFFIRPNDVIKSVAVLPFLNTTADPEAEYLSDGLSESVMFRLSQLQDLKVIARTSVFRYKGKEIDTKSVARELGVRAILIGRVTQHGDSLLVSAELVDAQNDRLLWGEQYNRKVTDLIPLQEDISRAIAEKLRLKLTADQKNKLDKDYTGNAVAYQLYLKGRYYWSKRTAEGLRKSIEYFQQAIESDPNYALAYAGLSDAYGALPYYTEETPQQAFDESRAAALRAIEIDPGLAEAHASFAAVENDAFHRKASEKELTRALELNPNYVPARYWRADVWARSGKLEEAIVEIRRAQEIDPLSMIVHFFTGYYLFFSRNYDLAIQELNTALDLDREFSPAYWQIGRCRLMKKEYKEALSSFETAMRKDPKANIKGSIGYLYAVTGETRKAEDLLQQLREESAHAYVPPGEFAIIYTGLGDKEAAFLWLNKAFDEHSQLWLSELKVNPMFDSLHSDPRYQILLHRMELD